MLTLFRQHRETVGMALMVVLAFLSFTLIQPGKENIADAYAVAVKPVPATDTATVVRGFSNQKAPTVVFIFASWCPVCKRDFPQLRQLAATYKDKGVNVVAFSVDRNKNDLTRYLGAQSPLSFTPYFVLQRFPGELQQGLRRAGIRYNGSIPYIALMGEDGKILGQGNYSVASVEKALQNLLP